MKPIYIKMSAFGSYAGEEIVDFTEVNHGIFLVTGDTGAGKTTIFDALTYALYDQTSGGKRDGEMMRSQYAEEEKRTSVELKFIYHGGTYTIIRSPKQNRISKKKNKDGEYTMTVDSPSVELIMPDGQPFKGKIKETNQKIVDLIGLDVNQFTQIAMIAQGDFLKLLHAPSKERKEIFAKIFNTKIYWRIEEELKARSKAMYGKLEDNRKDIERELENVQCSPESIYSSTWAEKARFSESDADSLMLLVKQIIEEAAQKETQIGKCIRANQVELDKVLEGIQQAKDINKLFEALEQANHQKEELDRKKLEMDQLKEKIDLAKKASIVEPKEAMFLNKKNDKEECDKRIAEIQEWLIGNKEGLENLKRLKDETEAEYKNKNPELTAKINKINELLPKYEQFEEQCSNRAILDKNRLQAKSVLERVIHNISIAMERQDKLIQDQGDLKEAADFLQSITHSVEKRIEKKNTLKNLLDSMKEIKNLCMCYENTEIEYQKARKDYEEIAHVYDTMYQQFIEGQAGILASSLPEGCPCPVCGSTDHPHLAPITDNSIGQKELQTEKKRMEAADKMKQAKYEVMQVAKQRYESEKNLAEHEGKKLIGSSFQVDSMAEVQMKSLLDDCEVTLTTELMKKSEAEVAKKKLVENELELKKLVENLKNYSLEKEAAEQSYHQLSLNIVQIDTVIASLKEALIYESKKVAEEELSASSELIQGLEISLTKTTDRYQKLLQAMTEKQGNLKTEEGLLLRLTEEVQKVEEHFLSEIKNQGFSEVNQYHSALMEPEKVEKIYTIYQTYREDVIKNDEKRKNYLEQTAGRSKVQTQEMEEIRKELEDQKLRMEQQSKTIYGIRSRDEDIYAKVRKLLDLRQESRDEYTILSRLDATANGKLSLCHMNFQTYIQRRYFKSILKEANKRLYQMSNGQFILQCRDVKDLSGQGEVGLDLDVYSMVNDQTRDVKTLSGGESFISALAMALGMADIIQNTAGSIHIDTMFIDEGFGSLSDETRMQAIHILNDLSEGKRLVGIISHVSELKAQIGTKLVVTKTEKGSRVKWDIGE